MPGFDLSGLVALVTGGNRGIGRGIALGLAGAGADVVIVGRDDEQTAAVVSEIEGVGRRALGVHCDVRARPEIDAAIEAAREQFGRLDILVNCAGVLARDAGAWDTTTEESWDLVIDTNLKASFQFAQAAYPLLREGGGKVVNLGSVFAVLGYAPQIAYTASKGGVVQLPRSLAVAWARDGIQVNAILPGFIRTDMTAVVQANEAVERSILVRTPARRLGTPEDISGVAVFLASSASDFITGQPILVDGGYSVT